jgi:hypothetical protein
MLRRDLGSLSIYWILTAFAAGQNSSGIPSPQGKTSSPVNAVTTLQATERHLVRVQTVTAPAEMANSFLTPLVCDSDGNLYFRGDGVDPIHKLNSKGEHLALFQASSNTDKKIDFTGYFALALDGDLYQLVFPHEFDRYLFVYKSDGTFKSAIKLNPGFVWSPHALAVFPSGQLLVAGSEYDHDRSAAQWPFTAIFAADGNLLKEVKLEDDDTLHDMAASGDARVSSPIIPNGNRAVDLSQIEMAADGNAYLMRWTNPTIIYAISAGGEIVRRLKIDPGGTGYRPSKMHVFQNRIAVLFVDPQTHDKLVKIVDLEGHDVVTYDELRANGKPQDEMLGTALACYTENPTRFTFLGANDDSKLQFWIAEPR